MNIATIKAEIIAVLDAEAQTKGETSELTDEENTDVTDSVAAKLTDLNPNHGYPPVNK